MVIASGGWIQNATYSPTPNNSNLSTSNTPNNKMAAKAVLICRANSHPFHERTVSLEQPVKIGRSVARARATPNNAIFDCKVLSRNHALLWYEAGKFYMQDTKSSNGTFINSQRLSIGGEESGPREVCSGDIVQFGVDVMENTRKVTHGCIVATLKLYLPDGKEAKASVSTSVASPTSSVSLEDLYKLNQFLQEANRREEVLNGKLHHLQRLVETTRQAADQSWKALIDEDRLLSRVETVESQLVAYSKNFTEDKIRNELVKLQEDKAQYQTAAKEALQKILQEKLEVTQKFANLERQLNNTEDECQSLHEVSKTTQAELQELAAKYTEAQTKISEFSNKLVESEDKMKDLVAQAEQEKKGLLKRIKDQARVEKILQSKLRDFRYDSTTIHEKVTALRKHLKTLQDMNLDLLTDETQLAVNNILYKTKLMSIEDFDYNEESNSYANKIEHDNQINSNSCNKSNIDVSLSEIDKIVGCILDPPSRRTLVNGNANLDNLDTSVESDNNSEVSEDACTTTSDDGSEKSVVEVKRTSEENSTPTKAAGQPARLLEVRFACEENGEPLEVHYDPVEQTGEESEVSSFTCDSKDIKNSAESEFEDIDKSFEVCDKEKKRENSEERDEDEEECGEGEHLDGDYIKTLKPISKNESAQQSLQSKEYTLQTLIGSLDSLKDEDNYEAQQLANKELDDLREWLIHESNETVISKLKELYYRAKNETQRIQEINEELVILKEKCNACTEENTELVKGYEALKAQCGDLLNVTYTVPIQYVAPIAIAFLWMLFEKIF
ncbi:sarcolemmal membrane-associated protein [Neodiprion virginianus]|uniref:sarcolemmal membrane-associated protein n=1 Tax=Neodiprion virginianus TaxID=2961670 RepID=UPI001EE6FD30|nr:sarcolemmal membrane-associated protein [Neodiprion virginianus]